MVGTESEHYYLIVLDKRTMNAKKTRYFVPHLQRYLFIGILTVIPIWITWVVFEFVFKHLSHIGMPWVRMLAMILEQILPASAQLPVAPWLQSAIAAVMTLLALYLLGCIASLVIGKRLLSLVDWVMNRIPLVQTIYGGVQKLLSVLQQRPDGVQRVVLIAFPTPEMRTVGFVTQVLKDHLTGREVAAVFVPTTPNPTSGYLEIVPVDRVIPTDWTVEEAMRFIVTGGTVAPDKIHYSRGEATDRSKEDCR